MSLSVGDCMKNANKSPKCVILGLSRDALYWKMKMKMFYAAMLRGVEK